MNPLDQLKDIHLPGGVSNWPPAYGWWLLAILIAVALIFSIKGLIEFRRNRLAKRQALKQLAQFKHTHKEWPVELNLLLKRLVISYFPQQDVAGLYLDNWCDFLTAQLPAKAQTDFRQQMHALQAYIYRPMGEEPDFISCITQAERWILYAIPPRANKIQNKELANV
jgi:hypothetical protein